MTVTGLDPEPRGGGVRVRLDGQPFATVAVADVADLALAVGRELSEAHCRELERRSEIYAARSAALRMLAVRALPRRELTRRLHSKGHTRPAVEAAVTALLAAGLVNDAEFARHHVRTHARRRLGSRRLVADLRRLGVDEREAEAAVCEVLDGEGVDSATQLREAAQRKLKSLAGLDRAVRARRLRAFLLRRGFGIPEVRAVVAELGG